MVKVFTVRFVGAARCIGVSEDKGVGATGSGGIRIGKRGVDFRARLSLVNLQGVSEIGFNRTAIGNSNHAI